METRRGRSRYTASMRSIWPVVDTFRMEGRELEPVLAPFGLCEADLQDAERRIAQDVVADLWDRAAELTGDASFGMRALQSLSPRRRGLLEFVLLNSPTLGAMIERGLRYERLWQEGREASLQLRGDAAVLRWTVRPGLRSSAPLAEFALGMVVLMGRAATGQRLPGEVRFPHPAPPALEGYTQLFGGPVLFSAGELSLTFSAQQLQIPLPEADSALLHVLEHSAQEVLARLPPARSVAQAVRAAVAGAFQSGLPSLQQVAERLRMSARTLRRRLEAEGTSYQSLVEELRRELAVAYLADARFSVTEIAFLLGFADAAAFCKAFRRWTGSSPTLARANLRNPGLATPDNTSGHD